VRRLPVPASIERQIRPLWLKFRLQRTQRSTRGVTTLPYFAGAVATIVCPRAEVTEALEDAVLPSFPSLHSRSHFMKANINRLVAIGSVIALVAVSGCASFDVSVSGEGESLPGATNGQDILKQMHADSQLGGE
jgi:hypothetical protein